MIATKEKELKDGLYPGMSWEEYFRLDAVNHSLLRQFAKTPAHALAYMTHGDDETQAQRVGHSIHAAVLEPGVFARQYVKALDLPRRSKADRKLHEEFEQHHKHCTILKPDEWDSVQAMRKAVFANPTVAELFTGKGINEAVIVWTDAETGLKCKGRVDRLTTWKGYSVVVDLKSARDADERRFRYAINDYGYHSQAAFYLDGLNALKPHSRRFLHVVVEKTPPYAVIVYEIGDISLDQGRTEYRRFLKQYQECQTEDAWPGYEAGVHPIDLPNWAIKTTEDFAA